MCPAEIVRQESIRYILKAQFFPGPPARVQLPKLYKFKLVHKNRGLTFVRGA